jgi:hypothetical protein
MDIEEIIGVSSYCRRIIDLDNNRYPQWHIPRWQIRYDQSSHSRVAIMNFDAEMIGEGIQRMRRRAVESVAAKSLR